MPLATQGWLNVSSGLREGLLEKLRNDIFQPGRAGSRCLLDHPLVRESAIIVRDHLAPRGLLDARSVAIQAIAFDKTPEVNWKVSWHQDLMFPLARMASAPDYTLACEKDGVPVAEPWCRHALIHFRQALSDPAQRQRAKSVCRLPQRANQEVGEGEGMMRWKIS
jgi:hypothetical protein